MATIADLILLSLVTVYLMSSCYGMVRDYYIAARDIVWDYKPDGKQDDVRYNNRYQTSGPPENIIGHTYYKTAYFQYSDQTFTREVPKPDYLGILGPLIAGEVGDVILVHFFNNASRSYSIHTHGVLYDKRSEGSIYLDGTMHTLKLDDGVPPGGRITLRWEVTDNDAPTAEDPNCLPWAYHSHVNSIKDVATGLFGVMITCKPGVLNKFNRRTDVDADYPLVIMNWNENLNFFLEDNIRRFCPNPMKCHQLNSDGDQHFINSNIMKSINGRSFGTLPGLRACTGDRVVFYVIGFGNEADVHSIHFHGQIVQHQHTRGDTISVYSATFMSSETTPTQSGDWLITDMVGEYEKEGIFAKYLVRKCGRRDTTKPRTRSRTVSRRYYLAVEEGIWNYAPSGLDVRNGGPVPTASSSVSPVTVIALCPQILLELCVPRYCYSSVSPDTVIALSPQILLYLCVPRYWYSSVSPDTVIALCPQILL
ncbi:hypothetical protein Btru_068388 [Bulinus truncatus]|nr:hypothetical protein Btru_068388 [Bulinus truncatus]